MLWDQILWTDETKINSYQWYDDAYVCQAWWRQYNDLGVCGWDGFTVVCWWSDRWKEQHEFWFVWSYALTFSQMDGASQCSWIMTLNLVWKHLKTFWRQRHEIFLWGEVVQFSFIFLFVGCYVARNNLCTSGPLQTCFPASSPSCTTLAVAILLRGREQHSEQHNWSPNILHWRSLLSNHLHGVVLRGVVLHSNNRCYCRQEE